MGESKEETGAQHESADADGVAEQASPEGTSESGDAGGSKSKAAAVAAGTAVAGVAGGIVVAARDTRRRVLGIPIGKRTRFQRGASAVADAAGTVVDKVREPAHRVGSRFSRDS